MEFIKIGDKNQRNFHIKIAMLRIYILCNSVMWLRAISKEVVHVPPTFNNAQYQLMDHLRSSESAHHSTVPVVMPTLLINQSLFFEFFENIYRYCTSTVLYVWIYGTEYFLHVIYIEWKLFIFLIEHFICVKRDWEPQVVCHIFSKNFTYRTGTYFRKKYNI